MWTSPTVSRLMSGITKIGQSSLFRSVMELFFLQANSHSICFLPQEQLKLSFFKTGQGPINGCVSLLWRDTANSPHLPLWKGKPISCPHDVSIIIWPSLPVVTGQGLAPWGPLLTSPCLLAWFTAHNDGYTEDCSTNGHTIAGTLPHLVPNTRHLKVSANISCPSGCRDTLQLLLPL